MSRAVWGRLTRLEAAARDSITPQPWAIMAPLYLSGSPEAQAQEAAFKLANPGRDWVLLQMVSGRLPVTA